MIAETFRGDVNELDRAVANLVQSALGLVERKRAVDHRGTVPDTGRQRLQLVLHERDEGRDDNGDPGQEHGRKLERQRLARAGWHDAERIGAGQHPLDHLPLPIAQGGVAEIALQHVENPRIERTVGGLGGDPVRTGRIRKRVGSRSVQFPTGSRGIDGCQRRFDRFLQFQPLAFPCDGEVGAELGSETSIASALQELRKTSQVGVITQLARFDDHLVQQRASGIGAVVVEQPGGHIDVGPIAVRIGGEIALQPGP